MTRSKKLSIERQAIHVRARCDDRNGSSADRMLEDVPWRKLPRDRSHQHERRVQPLHAILIVVVAPEDKASAAAEGVTAAALGEFGTAFYLVDLAGPSAPRSGVSAGRLTRPRQSLALSALGRVVTSLVERMAIEHRM